MKPSLLRQAVFAGLTLAACQPQAEAGIFFGRKTTECGPTCQQEQPKTKKKNPIGADDPPNAGIVELTPARFTTVRAQTNDDKKNTIPPAPAAEVESARVDKIEKDLENVSLQVRELRLQIEALVVAIEKKQ